MRGHECNVLHKTMNSVGRESFFSSFLVLGSVGLYKYDKLYVCMNLDNALPCHTLLFNPLPPREKSYMVVLT